MHDGATGVARCGTVWNVTRHRHVSLVAGQTEGAFRLGALVWQRWSAVGADLSEKGGGGVASSSDVSTR